MKRDNKKYYVFKMNNFTIWFFPNILLVLILFLTFLISMDMFKLTFEYLVDHIYLCLITYFGYMILHELLHSLAYVIYGGKFDKIVYGMELEKGVFYCLCKQNISKNNILHSLLYPFIFIGIITFLISIIFHLPLLLLLSIINLSGCSGDLVMFSFICKLPKEIEFSEFDDPTSFGIYSCKDISRLKHWGLTFVGECDTLDRNDLEKIKISKVTKIIAIILVALYLLCEFVLV